MDESQPSETEVNFLVVGGKRVLLLRCKVREVGEAIVNKTGGR